VKSLSSAPALSLQLLALLRANKQRRAAEAREQRRAWRRSQRMLVGLLPRDGSARLLPREPLILTRQSLALENEGSGVVPYLCLLFWLFFGALYVA
jgi:hypothetical protein